MSPKTILFVFTSADKVGDGRPVGWYLPEAAHPYYALVKHFNLIAASPKGGAPPLDPTSEKSFTDDESVRFRTEPEARAFWGNTRKLADVSSDEIDALFVVGGHGPVVDLAFDADLARLLAAVRDAGKPLAAVCHGPAAFNAAFEHKTAPDLVRGVKLTGFSNTEEVTAGYASYPDVLPFSLEDKLQAEGAVYSRIEDWAPYVVYDKGILTGQNPASAAPLGAKLREIMSAA